MASNGESSSTVVEPTSVKPVIVRVKRKITHSRLDAFWLEINERPSKRPLVDFEKLAISDSSRKEELTSKRVFVQHVKTVMNSDATIDIARSFVPYSADEIGGKTRVHERRDAFKKDNRQDQLSKSRQKQEELAKSARFEQVWRSRKGEKELVDDVCRFYDVVRVDAEERSIKIQVQDDMSLEDRRLLSSYLPLLHEFIPSAAEEIENDMQAYISEKDEFVYDYYAVKDHTCLIEEDGVNPFPLIQVDDEDFYDVPYESEYDSEDSNAEGNPLNDYPDEISEDDEEEHEGKASDESEEVCDSEKSLEDDDFGHDGLVEDWKLISEDEES